MRIGRREVVKGICNNNNNIIVRWRCIKKRFLKRSALESSVLSCCFCF